MGTRTYISSLFNSIFNKPKKVNFRYIKKRETEIKDSTTKS